MIKKKLFLCLLLISLIQVCAGQSADTLPQPNPRVQPEKKQELSRVNKANLYAIIPGGGQIYNKKYWKLPIVYGGFVALSYSFIFYKEQYDIVREAYKQGINNQPITNPELANVPLPTLLNDRESYHKSRDMCIIGMVGLYALQMIDAVVDAHLHEFDVSDNLAMKIEPNLGYRNGLVYSGLNLKLNLK